MYRSRSLPSKPRRSLWCSSMTSTSLRRRRPIRRPGISPDSASARRSFSDTRSNSAASARLSTASCGSPLTMVVLDAVTQHYSRQRCVRRGDLAATAAAARRELALRDGVAALERWRAAHPSHADLADQETAEALAELAASVCCAPVRRGEVWRCAPVIPGQGSATRVEGKPKSNNGTVSSASSCCCITARNRSRLPD